MSETYKSRQAIIAALVDIIVSLDLDHPTRVAIDGRSAAGKTTLADELAEAIGRLNRGVLRASIDDFHRPGHKYRSIRGEWTPETYYEQGYDYSRFSNLVLQPLGPGGSRSCCTAIWDSYNDAAIPEKRQQVNNRDIAIVEGVFLQHPALAADWDLVIWLNIDFETMVNRAKQRDVQWVGSVKIVEERYRRHWIPTHELYERITGAPSHAHAYIDNRNLEKPELYWRRKLYLDFVGGRGKL
jgi:Uridine kinase